VDWRYESVHLLRDGGQQHSEDYQALNPMREVPSLVIGDPADEPVCVLAQSVAILEYLEEVHPEPPLLPVSPVERARVRQVVEVLNSSIHPVQNLKVMKLLTAEFGTDRQANFAWAARWIERHFVGLERLVSRLGGAYTVGDQITLADVALVPQVFNGLRFGVDMKSYPILSGYYDKAMTLEAFQLAAPGVQPDAE